MAGYKWGWINRSGEVVIKPEWDEALGSGYQSKDLYYAWNLPSQKFYACAGSDSCRRTGGEMVGGG